MLINKFEENGFIEAIYESSNIFRSTYNTKDKILGVVFKSGVEYFYEGVSPKDYYAFELADSQGKVFGTKIKDHNFTKGGKVDIDSIKESIKERQKKEINSLKEYVVNICKEMTSYDVNKINELIKVVNTINKYEK